jgi:hypothetical protein
MAEQLGAMGSHKPQHQPERFNPRPPGVLQGGHTTAAVYKFLADRPDRFFSEAQLLWHLKRSHAAVSLALVYLRSLELVETAPDERNPRYRRYRIACGAQVTIASGQAGEYCR